MAQPADENAKRHDLLEVLTTVLTASVCGAESCPDLANFAVDPEDLVRELLRLGTGVPRHDTFSRIFQLLDPVAFAGCFGHFGKDPGASGAAVVAIDGKTLRRAFGSAAHGRPLAVATAFTSSTCIAVGQESFWAANAESDILADAAHERVSSIPSYASSLATTIESQRAGIPQLFAKQTLGA